MPRPLGPLARAALVVLAIAATIGLALVVGPLVHGGLVAVGIDRPYTKIFRYVTAVLLVALGLIALRPWRDVPPDLYGLRGPRSRPALVLAGAATALAVLVAIALFDAAAGHLSWDPRAKTKVAERWVEAVGRGIVVGLIEEVAFRGWGFTRLSRRFPVGGAAALVALVFAGIHGFRESRAPKGLAPSIESGLEILGSWGANVVDLHRFGPSFVGLFLLSLALTAAFLRFRTLWFGVGLHGAAVAWLPLHSAATQRDIERDWSGSKWLYDGAPGWVALGLLAWILWPRGRTASPTAPGG